MRGYLHILIVSHRRSFKKLILILIFVVLGSNIQSQTQPLNKTQLGKNWEELKGVEGLDFGTSPEFLKLAEDFLDQTIPTRKQEQTGDRQDIILFRPWYLWSYPIGKKQKNYLVLEISPQIIIHSETYGRLTCYANDGAILDRQQFMTGYGAKVKEADLIRETWLGYPLLSIKIDHIEGIVNRRTNDTPWQYRDEIKQFYSIKNQVPLLIRIENNRGQASRNRYYAPNLVYGQRHPLSNPDEIIHALNSADKVDVLKMLTWLGGVHINPRELAENKTKPPGKETLMESEEELIAVQLCWAHEKVKAAVQKLCLSPDPWIREAAKLAANPLYNNQSD